MDPANSVSDVPALTKSLGLKKIAPYWFPYTTYAKERWLNRELLEVVSTEFRDRSIEYYRYALASGVTTVNGEIAGEGTILRNGDRLENVVHKHEPPVTSTPVQVLFEDKERQFITVNKPGSIPVHATGRYHKNTLVEILVSDFGYEKVYPVNRLDRLTSGLMILPTSANCARELAFEFAAGTVRKVYVARVTGKFPEEEITCEEPMLTIDRQMGLNVVHPEGKPAKSVFKLIRYDVNTDSSVVECKPFTGRSHQLRVHLQYLGYPIANDPVYSQVRIWGENLGKGGIDTVPSEERSAPVPPSHIPEISVEGQQPPETQKLLPRETGEDIGMCSPVPLSKEAVGVITRLRNMKDEDEDWGRWRDVVFKAKGKLVPSGVVIKQNPHQKKKRRKQRERAMREEEENLKLRNEVEFEVNSDTCKTTQENIIAGPETPSTSPSPVDPPETPPSPPQLSESEALDRIAIMKPAEDPTSVIDSDLLYCPECYLPLHPDPKPEKLYIFLHALKYTTKLGTFETEMPEWSKEGWVWDKS